MAIGRVSNEQVSWLDKPVRGPVSFGIVPVPGKGIAAIYSAEIRFAIPSPRKGSFRKRKGNNNATAKASPTSQASKSSRSRFLTSPVSTFPTLVQQGSAQRPGALPLLDIHAVALRDT